MKDFQVIALALIISVLTSGFTAYIVATQLVLKGSFPVERIDQLSTEIASIKSSLSTLETSVGDMSNEVTEMQQSITELESEIVDINNKISSLSSEVSSLRIQLEKETAYQIFMGYMVDTGSNLAVPIASHIMSVMDQNNMVPSIFGYGKDQIKSTLQSLISAVLISVVPSSAWTKYDASQLTPKVYATSLKTAFPIKVNVFGMDINLARVIVVCTADVNIETRSVSDIRITEVLIG